MQRASRQYGNRELRFRACALTSPAKWRAPSVCGAALRPLGGFGVALSALITASLALAQSASETKAFQSGQFRYSVALPAGCRHEEGPGTLDAVCSTDFDPDKSAMASAASALVLEVGVEPVPEDAGKVPAELARRYDEAQFKAELPENVCGESDKTRVRIENVKQVVEETRVGYTADVACPEIKFLGLGERHARVEVFVTPGLRYRLMARAPIEEFEQHKEAVDAFFASFRIHP
jgi:hypothetical protein